MTVKPPLGMPASHTAVLVPAGTAALPSVQLTTNVPGKATDAAYNGQHSWALATNGDTRMKTWLLASL